ncbi:tRNA(Ile2) 2-agmatinylcytidine synthetase [Desulfocicer vacuolatum DSM 3385]|uniref:tRNA(Ile2) 2-agmatinylcytidine synthetase n=1 Tax=Desulfocicer vacuolatum DSM 3385 TaxID=1121400 RepID=A0A1W2AEN7_9BACT|nr:hypothetical protein [Desulfocicer vacuolatum]SMC58728.1 tRNA(Ile2) 2-agmatinylcytidine synthetase [Desulfocicer vacuolatum DSM 3385]
MKILVCIDDTDNLESRGTGQLSQLFAEAIEKKGWGNCTSISRHQLFVHEDIPYTSHNSSMCFKANIDGKTLQPLIDFMQKGLEIESAPGSDAGLCVAVDNEALDKKRLMAYGNKAKDTVLNKPMAYALAADLGIHLSEHGGTGDGIIGALAGVGLRLGGNDGRFRGWYHFDKSGTTMGVDALCRHSFVDVVKPLNGDPLDMNQHVVLGDDKVKIILQAGRQVLPVEAGRDSSGAPVWITLTKDRIKQLWP